MNKTNQEIIAEIQKEIRQSYSGIISEEFIERAIEWWTKLTLKALEAKDAEHKEDMREIECKHCGGYMDACISCRE